MSRSYHDRISRILKMNMHDEKERYLTFVRFSWPEEAHVSPSDLAKAGFFYFGMDDTVQCFSCNGRINSWVPGDTAMGEHRRLYPRCRFPKGTDTKNIPATDLTVKYAKYPYRAYEQTRLETYRRWPRNHSHTPTNLARAGFFSTGNEDEVKCFCCGGGLMDWAEGDVPWEEHARWFSRCEWLLQQRGSGFVNAVRRKYGPSELYFEPNLGIHCSPLPASRPPPPGEIRILPHQFTVTSMAAGSEPRRMAPRRKPEIKQSEATKKESRTRPAEKKQQGKKKQGKKKSLNENPAAGQPSSRIKVKMTRFPTVGLGMSFILVALMASPLLERQLVPGDRNYVNPDLLESRDNLTSGHVIRLYSAPRELNLRLVTREATSVVQRMRNRAQTPREEESQFSDFEPDQDFGGVLNELSKLLRDPDTGYLCTHFALSGRERDNILDSINPAETILMFLYKRGIIEPDDVSLLTRAFELREHLKYAAWKLKSMLRIHPDKNKKQSEDTLFREDEEVRKKFCCTICLHRIKAKLFLPCQHLATCVDCASVLSECPICRRSIKAKVTVKFAP